MPCVLFRVFCWSVVKKKKKKAAGQNQAFTLFDFCKELKNQKMRRLKNSIRKRPFFPQKNAKTQKKRTRHFWTEKCAHALEFEHTRARVRADAFGNEFVFRRVKIPERDFHAPSFFLPAVSTLFNSFLFEKFQFRFLFSISTSSELDYWKISFFDQTFFLCRRPTLKGCRHFGRRRPFFWPRSLRTRAFLWPKMPRALFLRFCVFLRGKRPFSDRVFSGSHFRKKCTLDGTSKSKKVHTAFRPA